MILTKTKWTLPFPPFLLHTCIKLQFRFSLLPKCPWWYLPEISPLPANVCTKTANVQCLLISILRVLLTFILKPKHSSNYQQRSSTVPFQKRSHRHQCCWFLPRKYKYRTFDVPVVFLHSFILQFKHKFMIHDQRLFKKEILFYSHGYPTGGISSISLESNFCFNSFFPLPTPSRILLNRSYE